MIIHAVSIHSGGGKVLLDHLLSEEIFGKISNLICDERYILPSYCPDHISIHRIKPRLLNRWKAEILLKTISNSLPHEDILCFSNLPPAFRLKTKVILYLQNALLLPNTRLYATTFRSYARLVYEKCWLNFFLKNCDEVWVQTQWMKNAFAKKGKSTLIKSFLPILPRPDDSIIKKYDFITVSGSAPHKRLYELLEAWQNLSSPAPRLLVIADCLSLRLKNKLDDLKFKNVTYKTNVSRDEVFIHYQESRNLILTSRMESFCLPLYEAKHFNLKIIAPDEGYTHDMKNSVELLENFSTEEIVKKVQKLF